MIAMKGQIAPNYLEWWYFVTAHGDHNHHCLNVSRLNCSKLPIMIVLGDQSLQAAQVVERNSETLKLHCCWTRKDLWEGFLLYCITLYLICSMAREVGIHIAKVKVKPIWFDSCSALDSWGSSSFFWGSMMWSDRLVYFGSFSWNIHSTM